MRKSMISLVVPALLGLAGTCLADDFRIINRSNQTVYAAVSWYEPGGRTPPPYDDWVEPQFVTKGWYIIQPGQSQVIYSGRKAELKVRMHFADGRVIVPQRHNGTCSLLASNAGFTLYEYPKSKTGRFSGEYGGKFVSGTVDDMLRDSAFSFVDGFYALQSATDFTVR